MTIWRGLPVIVVLLAAGCGGEPVLECSDKVAYLDAREMPRVRAPSGMDDLDALKEIPLPEASPQAPRPADAGCLEKPPVIEVE